MRTLVVATLLFGCVSTTPARPTAPHRPYPSWIFSPEGRAAIPIVNYCRNRAETACKSQWTPDSSYACQKGDYDLCVWDMSMSVLELALHERPEIITPPITLKNQNQWPY